MIQCTAISHLLFQSTGKIIMRNLSLEGINGPIQSFWLCSSWSFTWKLATYGVDENCLYYIYSYLPNRKQWVRINNINTDFLNVISGVPQGSILAPILFNCSLMTFFNFTETADAHNFADDNKLRGSHILIFVRNAS